MDNLYAPYAAAILAKSPMVACFVRLPKAKKTMRTIMFSIAIHFAMV